MRPQTQLFRHDPENGIWGDCWRTAWATILDLDATEVPHFCEGGREDYTEVRDEWLAGIGLCAVTTAFAAPLEQTLTWIGHYNKQPYLLTGMSPRGTSHVVVCLGGSIVHDPHPDGGGLVGAGDDGLFWAEFAGRALLEEQKP